MIARERLKTILGEFPRLTIGLVGDLFLDRYLEIDPDAHEFSLETGLEAFQVFRVRNSPGALGTVINNLVALGVGRLVPLTVIGDDGHGYDLRRALGEAGNVATDQIIADPDRLTPTYTKPLKRDPEGFWGELNRLDVRSPRPVSGETSRAVCDRLCDLFDTVDGWIVLDQINEPDWGVINSPVREALATLGRNKPDKLILVDSRTKIREFHCAAVKGNLAELTSAFGFDQNQSGAQLAMERLLAQTERPVYCTMGAAGILIGNPKCGVEAVPGHVVTGSVDIVGAGDSATSGLVASLLAGASQREAAVIANLVASITIQQIGTTGTASPQMVIERWQQVQKDADC